MLTGITITPLTTRADERGFFTELLRQDWLPDADDIRQSNFSITYPQTIRAWHRHVRGQTDYFIVLAGAIQLCAYNDQTKELTEIITTGDVPQMVRVPGHYWHGFKVVGDERAHLIYFTTTLYDYADPDEERLPWDDPSVTPSTINGRTDDPRCHTPWNWWYRPFR